MISKADPLSLGDYIERRRTSYRPGGRGTPSTTESVS
jgi:hypothetical protein